MLPRQPNGLPGGIAPRNPFQVSQQRTSAVSPAGASLATNVALSNAAELVQQGRKLDLPVARVAGPSEEAELVRQIQQLQAKIAQGLIRKGQRGSSRAESMLIVLDKNALSRKVSGLDDPQVRQQLAQRLEDFAQRQQGLTLVLPLGGGKVDNPLKTGSSWLPDASEWVAGARLAALAEALEYFLGAPVRVILLPDAPLHTADLGFSGLKASAHIRQLNVDLERLGWADKVLVPHPADWVGPDWNDVVAAEAKVARQRIREEAEFAANAQRQTASLRFSLNQEVLALGYEDQVLVMAHLVGLPGPIPTHLRKLAEQHQARTEAVTPHYIGVNHAIRVLDLPARAAKALTGDPAYLRLTVHPKPGEPRPALHQDGPLARPGLLPMHSVAVRYAHKGELRIASQFELEARLKGYTPVLSADGLRVLYFEATGDHE